MAKNTKLRDKDRAIRQAVRVNEVEIQIAKLFFFLITDYDTKFLPYFRIVKLAKKSTYVVK